MLSTDVVYTTKMRLVKVDILIKYFQLLSDFRVAGEGCCTSWPFADWGAPEGCWDPPGRSAVVSWSVSSCWGWREGRSSGSCSTPGCCWCPRGWRSPWSGPAAWPTWSGWPPRSWSGMQRSWLDICSDPSGRSTLTRTCGPTRSLKYHINFTSTGSRGWGTSINS